MIASRQQIYRIGQDRCVCVCVCVGGGGGGGGGGLNCMHSGSLDLFLDMILPFIIKLQNICG